MSSRSTYVSGGGGGSGAGGAGGWGGRGEGGEKELLGPVLAGDVALRELAVHVHVWGGGAGHVSPYNSKGRSSPV